MPAEVAALNGKKVNSKAEGSRPEPNVPFILLQFLKISPIILPNMPIILLLFSSVTHICWSVIMKIVTYTKQCHDYTMMYGIMTLHGLKSVEEYYLFVYNSVLIKGIFEHEQSTFQQ